eukprot:g1419.t1
MSEDNDDAICRFDGEDRKTNNDGSTRNSRDCGEDAKSGSNIVERKRDDDTLEAKIKDLRFDVERKRVESAGVFFVPDLRNTNEDLRRAMKRHEEEKALEASMELDKQLLERDLAERSRKHEKIVAAKTIQRYYRGFKERSKVSFDLSQTNWTKRTLPANFFRADAKRIERMGRTKSQRKDATAPLLRRKGNMKIGIGGYNNDDNTKSFVLPPLSHRSDEDAEYLDAEQLLRTNRKQGDTLSRSKCANPSRTTRTLRNMTQDARRLYGVTPGSERTPNGDPPPPQELELERATRDKLFLPDGRANVLLSETVRNALRVTRFDSISTLLASSPVISSGRGSAAIDDASMADMLHSNATTPYVMRPTTKLGQSPRRKMTAKSYLHGDARASPSTSRNNSLAQTTPSFTNSLAKGGTVVCPSVRPITHAGFHPTKGALNIAKSANTEGVCFGCFSAGVGKSCMLHTNGPKRMLQPEQSNLVCGNWDLGALRRKYRAEEIQERFNKTNKSLRWNADKKGFSTIFEQKHPIYRELTSINEHYVGIFLRKQHAQMWLRSFMDTIRIGKCYQASKTSTPSMFRLHKTLTCNSQIIKYTQKQRVPLFRLPRPPLTRDTTKPGQASLRNERDEIRPDPKDDSRSIIVTPTPKPVALYRARSFTPMVPVSCEIFEFDQYLKLPSPTSFSKRDKEETKSESCVEDELSTLTKLLRISPSGKSAPKPWQRAYARSVVKNIISRTSERISTMRVRNKRRERKYRTRHPPIVTDVILNVFDHPGRGEDNFAVGGLTKGCTLCQKLMTRVPQQYGNFQVIKIQPIASLPMPETTARSLYGRWYDSDHANKYDTSFEYSRPHAACPPCGLKPLDCAINHLRAPTITASNSSKRRETTYHGPNRPDITGHTEYQGFRTTHPTTPFVPVFDTEPRRFVPSDVVALSNDSAVRPTVTSHANLRNYPFRETTTRENTLLDFYHLLPGFTKTSNTSCMFTTLGRQDPGQFGFKNDLNGKMGPLDVTVFRSFCYAQTGEFEEFTNQKGVPYWYNKRTGETYWEPPLDFMAKPSNDDDIVAIRGIDRPLEQTDVRRHMLMKHGEHLQQRKDREALLEDRKMLADEEEEQGGGERGCHENIHRHERGGNGICHAATPDGHVSPETGGTSSLGKVLERS